MRSPVQHQRLSHHRTDRFGQKVYTDWTDDDGEFLFSRLEPGGELYYGTAASLLSETVFAIPVDYYRYMVLK